MPKDTGIPEESSSPGTSRPRLFISGKPGFKQADSGQVGENEANQGVPSSGQSGDGQTAGQESVQEVLPDTSLHQAAAAFRQALWEKIRSYPSGIEGVWRALDGRFKSPENRVLEGIKGESDFGKIKRDAFRRQVTRLKDERQESSRLTLTIPTEDTLLLFHIMEILEINKPTDLMKPFNRPDIDAINRATYINTQSLLKKATKLLYFAETKKRPRLSDEQVFEDWEGILMRVNDIINMKENNDFSYSRNPKRKAVDNRLFAEFLRRNNGEYFHPNVYRLFDEYKEYFLQDLLLYKYMQEMGSKKGNNFNECPLYVLYFLLKVNNRYLSIFRGKKYGGQSLFKLDQSMRIPDPDHEQSGEEYEKELLAGETTDKFIFTSNNEMLRLVKSILTIINKSHVPVIQSKHDEYFKLLKSIVENMHSIYINNVQLNNDKFEKIIQKIKKIKDVYKTTSLGLINFFLVNECHIKKINQQREDLETILTSCERDVEHLAN